MPQQLKKKIIFLVSGLALIVVIIIISQMIEYRAADDNNAVALTADFSIVIYEKGEPAVGKLIINGDCPTSPINSERGTFSCKLTKSAGENQSIMINSNLGFQSFTTDQTVSIFLMPLVMEKRLISIPQEKTIQLIAELRENGVVSLRQWTGTQFEFVDPKIGIRTNF